MKAARQRRYTNLGKRGNGLKIRLRCDSYPALGRIYIDDEYKGYYRTNF